MTSPCLQEAARSRDGCPVASFSAQPLCREQRAWGRAGVPAPGEGKEPLLCILPPRS